jgi:hypothetical protein
MTANGHNTVGPLRALLDRTRVAHGCTLGDLTVLAPQNDPMRVDTPAGHRDGAWLAMHAETLGDRRIHLRGLHYMLLGKEEPSGGTYSNTQADWGWLQNDAAKAARWLQYIPWDRVVDARNSPPVIRVCEETEPEAYIGVADVDVLVPEELTPRVDIDGFYGRQPYKLVLVGEKTSLEEVLAPIAASRQADLYLPAGELSDTLIHQMASAGARDGRRMFVFYLSDCDPAGWQMPVSVAQKLRAFRELEFPELEFEVRPVALTPGQVREYGLPSAPLKETERRADRWAIAMGVQQTEIDALATLQPDLLARITRDAIKPFYDVSLDRRVHGARAEWQRQAQAMLEQQLGPDTLARIRDEAESKLAGLQQQVDAINAALRVDVADITLPPAELPAPEITTEPDGKPLISSDWSYHAQARRLIARKKYEELS